MSRTQEAFIPDWTVRLEKDLEAMADELAGEVQGWNGPETVFTPEEFGRIPGEKATSASAGPVLKDSDFSEMRGVYPDAHMIDETGDAPAFGLWARHAKGLHLDHYEVHPAEKDPRPFIELSDEVPDSSGFSPVSG